ncbi:cyclophilin-like domain-containing protein [Kockovaella imperatae]|uniref:Peptidyl-prolyl isomerase CWC27 n=1 Tax=Kockovaella imperatae TaxID=4999 RepID=A0A1Y1UCZ5_9TREE|nr:cyclophilin-like domain-containing protein [Kockovaella imperatae]ORX35921.1 cyclophilin-like domain-containing protein [Kockovaella imperatae]
MSNLYVTEPATNGKIIIDTTAGEIEVELWGKEAPKAVRNFLALTMEGYYDGVIFHRIVPGFIVQTGDPTGTGMGGESFYGEPFQDEIHGRLKFHRRGLVGMANSGKRNTNTSQFFITLDRAEELTGKHTLFGKITGNTVFNVLNIGNLEIDDTERPKIPPKIRGIRIVENPFDDIVPRITVAEKKAQAKARAEAKKEAEAREKRSRAKKNTGLLSFGEAEEIPDDPQSSAKKNMGRRDLVETAGESSSKATPPRAQPNLVELPPSLHDLAESSSKPREKKIVDIREIRAQHDREKQGDSAARQAEIKKMQEDLRKLKKKSGQASDSDSDSDAGRRRKKVSYLDEELAKYSKGRGRAAKSGNRRSRKDEEDDLLLEMGRFSKRVAMAGDDDEGAQEDEDMPEPAQDLSLLGGPPNEELEVDDDVGWLKHKLRFVVDEKELTRRAEEEYAVIDPRAKARQLASEEKREKDNRFKGSRTAGDVGRRR